MGDFTGMEDLLSDFLTEASELLSDVDSKLMDLEKYPDNKDLLNTIFRGFHTIKGGAGFLNATELVTLCHLTENLFDKLRNAELKLDPVLMDVIMADMNGFQACRTITNDPDTKGIPVILVSSKGEKTDKVWGNEQGARGYVTAYDAETGNQAWRASAV